MIHHRGTEDTEGSQSRGVHDIAGASIIDQLFVGFKKHKQTDVLQMVEIAMS
jgi:hypothetical protein